ncbi:diacylglycerol kinase family protein [Lutibacter sp.]|uniref:diacylglycerol/lipid kinase family protein n=1 Tax=Lutibacter sp. TaxID=1925666 RepID=UPI001A3036B9|nr:diacylglycerol kinase family protein [Lutibacter sp.]MBI9040874.1 diacylglycerol kinase family lipid kinase [Lutibacter sp.]
MSTKWFIVINPTSGNGASKKKWPAIFSELNHQNFEFDFVFTEYERHSIKLVQNAIKQGFTKFICVGGDGTIHNFVNAVLGLNPLNIKDIKIGIIPIGTGNDWVKTYNISKDFKEAIKIIKAEKTIIQDIGKLQITDSSKEVYFNNLAGIGFDGYVVNKVHKYKNLGFLAYFTGAIVSLTSYKKSNLEVTFNNTILKGKTLMLLIGICKYSGGGMQLTQNSNATDGLFDITFVDNITLLTLLRNLRGLFNGNITTLNCVKNYKSATIKITVLDTQETYIQADGEIIGSGNFTVSILPKAIQFIVA